MKATLLRNNILVLIVCLIPFSIYAKCPRHHYRYVNQSYTYNYTDPPHVVTVEPNWYSRSSETIPNRYSMKVYTNGTRGQVADTIAFHVFRNFLHDNDYSYYNVVGKPKNYGSAYSIYTVDFYRSTKVGYGY